MDYEKLTQAIAADVGAKDLRWLPPAPPRWDGEGSHSDWHAKMIETPKPVSPNTLAAFAHEAGHLATTPATYSNPEAEFAWQTKDLTGQIVREWRATKWGWDAIEKHGGEVTDGMKRFWAEALISYVHDDPYDMLFAGKQPDFPQLDQFMRQWLR